MLGWPVVLVIDPSGQAQTAAAIAAGLRDYRAGVRLAGVVLNRVASPRHEDLVRRALNDIGIAVFGALPRHAEISLPKRHLGLVQAEEQAEIGKLIDEAARFVAEHVDLDAVLRVGSHVVAATSGERPERDAAGPAHCTRPRCRVLLHLSAYAGSLARGRRRDLDLLAACR